MNTSVTTVADYLTTPPTSPHRVRINFAASPDEPLAITGDPVGTELDNSGNESRGVPTSCASDSSVWPSCRRCSIFSAPSVA